MSDALSLVDPKYLVNLKGKQHPTYPGVLEAAMKAGLLELSVKVVQVPGDGNGGMAICEATACFPGPDGRERIFSEVGDCDGTNCTPHIAPHRIRMAATRAKGRALRDALGIGVALVEEMTNEREDGMARPAANGQSNGAAAARGAATDQRGAAVGTKGGLVSNRSDGPPTCTGEECTAELTRDEILGSAQRGWPPLCKACGSKRKAQERADAEELRQMEAASDELGTPA